MVATPIGNLDDITARAIRVLGSVAVIAAEDTRRTAGLLAHFGITTPTISLHEHNEASRTPRLIERLLAGESIAVVSDAGTPTVSDPGQRLVKAAADAGVRIEPIPGASAVLAAIAASGFEGDSFTFLGFPPIRSRDRKQWLAKLETLEGVAVFFEAPHRVIETLAEVGRLLGPATPIMIGRELTKVHEELVRGPIYGVLQTMTEPRGEYTIVLEIGRKTENSSIAATSETDWLNEIGEITKTMAVSRRKAINVLAKRRGMAQNEVYAAVERAKKSVK